MTVKDMIRKELDRLRENDLSEVLDFIRFLELKSGDQTLVNSAQRVSERSFSKVWDNEEDAVYDAL